MPLNRKVLPICFLLSFQGYAPLKETRIPSPLPWDFWEVEKRMRFPAHIIGSSPRPNTSYLTRRASPAQDPVAQLVEQLPCKELVPGSNPGGGCCNSIISGGGFCRNHAPIGLKEMQGRRRLRDCELLRNISSMADVEGRALCPGSIPGIPNTLPEVDLAQSITADGRLKRNV